MNYEIVTWLIGMISAIIGGLIFTYYETEKITGLDIILWGISGIILSWYTIFVIIFVKLMICLEDGLTIQHYQDNVGRRNV